MWHFKLTCRAEAMALDWETRRPRCSSSRAATLRGSVHSSALLGLRELCPEPALVSAAVKPPAGCTRSLCQLSRHAMPAPCEGSRLVCAMQMVVSG